MKLKSSRILFAVLSVLALPARAEFHGVVDGGVRGRVRPAANSQTPTERIEKSVLDVTNRLRTNPKSFIPILEKMKASFDGDIYTSPGSSVHLKTHEGISAINETIAFLKSVRPIPPLTASGRLADAAREIQKDQSVTGDVGHVMANGRDLGTRLGEFGAVRRTAGENASYGYGTGMEIVLQLLIDDGVTNRGHRTNLMNPDFRQAGVAFGPHAKYRWSCTIDYADDFGPR